MKKVLILAIGIVVLALLEPRSRAAIIDRLEPVLGVRERGVTRTLEGIAREMQREADRNGTYPTPSSFRAWLTRTDQEVRDPWGSPYYLELLADSLVVGSAGPDARPRTADDLRLKRPRDRRATPVRAGGATGGGPVKPPPSSYKRKAMSTAQSASERASGKR